MKMSGEIYNGSVLVMFEGKYVNGIHALDYPYAMPYAALSCELADDCKDYDQEGKA